MTALEIAAACRAALDEGKARDVVVLDVRALSSVTDYFVIASGTSQPHLRALHDRVHLRLKEAGQPSYHRSSESEASWFCLDFVDVVVHIMSDEARAYYALDALWAEAPRI